jgi:histidine kinase
LRRIERDLHDGAQVRLAALAMTLGEIKESLDAAAAANGGVEAGAT